MGIEKDHARFRDMVKGKVRKDIRKYMTNGELIGKEGKRLISIPVPGFDTPHFRYGPNDRGGIGSGEGDVGEYTDPSDQENEGESRGGTEEGRHLMEMEVDLEIEEIEKIAFGEMHLQDLKPQKQGSLTGDVFAARGMRRIGPRGQLLRKRSFLEMIKRGLILPPGKATDNQLTKALNNLYLEPTFRRYRDWQAIPKPEVDALLIFIRDVSGSMGEFEKKLSRLICHWTERWVRRNYKKLSARYIVHDVKAREVPRDVFYRLQSDGGTKISSAYHACIRMIDEYLKRTDNPNIYIMHVSDGDNESGEDNNLCYRMIANMFPSINLFGYVQVKKGSGGEGAYHAFLKSKFGKLRKVRLAKMNEEAETYDVMRQIFGKPGEVKK